MQTGLAALTHDAQRPITMSTTAAASSHCPLSARRLCRAPARKLSIAPWPMPWPNAVGSDSFSRSFIDLYALLLWSTVTTCLPSTCRPIQSNIVTPSTSRSTSTLFQGFGFRFAKFTAPERNGRISEFRKIFGKSRTKSTIQNLNL